MNIRKTTLNDLTPVIQLFEEAKKFMASTGNPNQWNRDFTQAITDDIALGQSYVCVENDEILGTFCFCIGEDPTYIEIYDGNWLNQDQYGVIHRITAKTKSGGVGSFCVDYCKSICDNIKIDTHHDNTVMQSFLTKHDFVKCGEIRLENGDPRIAYQYKK